MTIASTANTGGICAACSGNAASGYFNAGSILAFTAANTCAGTTSLCRNIASGYSDVLRLAKSSAAYACTKKPTSGIDLSTVDGNVFGAASGTTAYASGVLAAFCNDLAVIDGNIAAITNIFPPISAAAYTGCVAAADCGNFSAVYCNVISLGSRTAAYLLMCDKEVVEV